MHPQRVKRIYNCRRCTSRLRGLELDEEASVSYVLERIAQEYGDWLNGLLFDEAHDLHPLILLFVGDTQVRGTESPALKADDLPDFGRGSDGNKNYRPQRTGACVWLSY